MPRPRVTAPQQRRLSRCWWDGVVPSAPSSPLPTHNAGRRVLGVARSPRGMPSAGQPRRVLASPPPPHRLLPFTFRRSGDRVHGLLSATGRRWIKEGARAHSCRCCGVETGSAVLETPHTPWWVPKCHSARRKLSIKVGRLWEYLRAASGTGDRDHLGELSGGTAEQTSNSAAFPSSPTNKPHFPGSTRPNERTGAGLGTIPLQQGFAFAGVKRGDGEIFPGKI